MKKLVLGTLTALVVLATVAAVAAAVTSSDPIAAEAKVRDQQALPAETLKPSLQTDEDESAHGFIGIAIATVTEAEAEEPGQAGRARVVRVFDGGPSDGVLAKDDIIVSVDGVDIPTVAALIETVRSHAPGDVIEIGLWGQTDPVSVTVGEHDGISVHRGKFTSRIHKRLGPGSTLLHGMFGHPLDRFVSGELVVTEDDNGGLKTIAGVAGTVTGVDVNAESVTLDAKDGSGLVTFTIASDGDDATLVIVDGSPAELGEIEIGEAAVVVTETGSADGVQHVRLVLVGNELPGVKGGLGFLGQLDLPGFGSSFSLDHLGPGLLKRLGKLDSFAPHLRDFDDLHFGRDGFGGGSFFGKFEVECEVTSDPDDPNKTVEKCTHTSVPEAPAAVQ